MAQTAAADRGGGRGPGRHQSQHGAAAGVRPGLIAGEPRAGGSCARRPGLHRRCDRPLRQRRRSSTCRRGAAPAGATSTDPAVTTVEVWVDVGREDVPSGTLHTHWWRGTETATFTYDAQYVARAGAYALEPGLPLRSGSRQTPTGHAVFGAFGDCAPDRWGRTLLKRREAALARAEGRAARALSEADYMLGIRDDLRQGAVRSRVGRCRRRRVARSFRVARSVPVRGRGHEAGLLRARRRGSLVSAGPPP